MKSSSPFSTSSRTGMAAIFILLAVVVSWGEWVVGAAVRPPNFLFVYTDDQRWDALGVVQREQGPRARYPWLQTPHLDRLAAEGIRFRNAFVTLSLCAPSRAAFLTGRYNHHNGVANNHTPFPVHNVTHASLLRAAGYRTAYVGKWHHGNQSGPRPGFDYSASFIGQGRYRDCSFEINGKPTPTLGWVDDVSTDYAIEFMRKQQEKPFSMIVGFKAAHGPNDPPERARNRFADAQARPVPNLQVPAIYRRENKLSGLPTVEKGAFPTAVKANLNYFRCISAMDDNVGRLLQALDDLGMATNTVVVFASDNGYYHGEHQLGDKRSAYEESLRIPLLLRYPPRVGQGKVCDDMVLNIDLAPTFLELAGVAVPQEMQGRSWVPLLTRKRVHWRESFLAEYFYEQNFPGIPTVVAVRTTTAKLIKYPGHEEWTELFDLAQDPYETNNLFHDPKQKKLRKRMEAEFGKQVQVTGYHIPVYADPPGSTKPAGEKKSKNKRE